MLREFNFIRKIGKLSLYARYTFFYVFKPHNCLGEGSFGSVYLVKRISDNLNYALKKVSEGQLNLDA